jgi:hypothetical protein
MPIIHTQVKYNSNVIFFWKGLPITKEMTISEFFFQVVKNQINHNFHSLNFEVKFGNSKNNVIEDVSIECNAFEAISFYGPYCIFSLESTENTEEFTNVNNAFDILMVASTSLSFPTFKTSENAKLQLQCDIVEWIKKNGGGWIGIEMANNIGSKFVKDLTNAIWYVDKCSMKTLNDRYKIPSLFEEFFGHADPQKHKHARPSFNSQELEFFSINLTSYVELPWMLKSNFSWLKESLNNFAEILMEYAEYLENKKISSAKNKHSLIPIVNEDVSGFIKIYPKNSWRNPSLIPQYQQLQIALDAAYNWEPIYVNPFCPKDRK